MLAPAALGFATCAATLFLLLRAGVTRYVMDHPNDRSLHGKPVPRIGGIGIMAGVTLGLGVTGGLWLALLSALGLMLLSVVDDWRDLPAAVRLFGHLGVASGFCWLALDVTSWPALVASILAVTWMANLYNFMDGADGLAGGMAVFGFGAYAVAAWIGGDIGLATDSLAIAAAALAFLLFNFPPARLFMGDAGSVPLGFLAGALGIVGWQRGLWPLWFGPVAFAPFCTDATVTLIRRALRGEKVWRAHRTHYYQRQVLMGWSHRKLAIAAYLLMAFSAAIALVVARADPYAARIAMAALVVVYTVAMVAIDLRWARRSVASA